jgi:hypothetical protein
MSIVELIEAGNMDARTAAFFWIAMERGASLIIAADPPHSGKTTTLSALMSFTRTETAVYFTQGQGEPFALPRVSDSYDTYILVNEMSDPIPVYTWDHNARRCFELLAEGYRLATTMHDVTTEGVLGQLERDLGIPKRQLANLTFVVPMYVGHRQGIIRRVIEVAMLQPLGDGYALFRAVTWDDESDTFAVLQDDEALTAFAAWARMPVEDVVTELQTRAAFLNALCSTGIREIPQVAEAIISYYETVIDA